MTDENIQHLLGGFATGTLTEDERSLLFSAALKDQELFNALADEEVLREFLSDPAARRRLLQLLQPEAPGVFDRFTSWMRRPAAWISAGAVVATLIVAVAIRNSRPPAVDMVRTRVPEAAAPMAAQQPPSPIQAETETRTLARRDEPSRVLKKEPAAAPKMKVAVLEFDSGAVQSKKDESKSADLGKTASDLLGKRLDSDGYTVIDRKQVVQAMQAQKLNERQLSPAAAASLGRSLGADAVIMGSVKPSVAMNLMDGQVAGGARQERVARAKAPAAETVAVTATAINPQNAVSLGFVQGPQTAPPGLPGAVDQVASSLGQQLQQNARFRSEGLVTDVNAKIVTLNIGAQAGVKVGDRLEIRRAGKPIGRVAITSVQDTFSVGLFDGSDPVKTGDLVANQ